MRPFVSGPGGHALSVSYFDIPVGFFLYPLLSVDVCLVKEIVFCCTYHQNQIKKRI